jgi:hypothetical protein
MPFDPLIGQSINVLVLDDKNVKASILIREVKPLEQHAYELLRPLEADQRIDIISDTKWNQILDVKVGDTVWFYHNAIAANVSAKSRLNGNYGRVNNLSKEKDVGFVQYIGPIDTNDGFYIGIELFLESNRYVY